jgi:hypothetical protein
MRENLSLTLARSAAGGLLGVSLERGDFFGPSCEVMDEGLELGVDDGLLSVIAAVIFRSNVSVLR